MTIFPLLLASLSTLTLFLVYRSVKSEKKIKLPSLFLIKKLKPRAVISSKKRYPPRFYIELLIILSCLTILLLLITKTSQKTYNIIIDRSLSTASPYNGTSKLEAIKSDIIKLIENESTLTTYSLEVTPKEDVEGINPQIKLSGTDAIKKIKSLRTSSLQDNLNRLTSVKEERSQALIFTDKKITSKSIEQRQNYFQKENNVGLVSATSTRNSSEVSIFLNYFYSGEGSNYIDITVKEVGSTKSLLQKRIDILHGGEGSFKLIIPNLDPKIEFLSLEIVASLHKETLLEDNITFSKIEQNKERKVLLISNDLTNRSKLESLGEIISSELEFVLENDLKQEQLKKANFVIYYNTIIKENISSPTLVILPPRSSEILEVNGLVKDPKISSWNEDSNLTRYINFNALKLSSALKFDEVHWGNPVIRVNGSISMLEGNINGNPIIVSGLELLPYEGKNSPSSSILMLNIIKKFSLSQTKDTEKIFRLEPNLKVRSLNTNLTLEGPRDLPSGVYELIDNSAEKKPFLSNSYSQDESDIFRLKEDYPEIDSGLSKNEVLNDPLLRSLLMVIIALIAIDLAIITILGREV